MDALHPALVDCAMEYVDDGYILVEAQDPVSSIDDWMEQLGPLVGFGVGAAVDPFPSSG